MVDIVGVMSENQSQEAHAALVVSLSEKYGVPIERVRSLATPLYWEGHRLHYPDPHKYVLDHLPAQASRSLRPRDGRPVRSGC